MQGFNWVQERKVWRQSLGLLNVYHKGHGRFEAQGWSGRPANGNLASWVERLWSSESAPWDKHRLAIARQCMAGQATRAESCRHKGRDEPVFFFFYIYIYKYFPQQWRVLGLGSQPMSCGTIWNWCSLTTSLTGTHTQLRTITFLFVCFIFVFSRQGFFV